VSVIFLANIYYLHFYFKFLYVHNIEHLLKFNARKITDTYKYDQQNDL